MASHSSKPSTLPKDFPLDYLRKITDEFSSDRIIHQGATGTVYKGIGPDGEVIAVKRLSSKEISEKLFQAEVQNLVALHHQNIVSLIGYSHESELKVVERDGKYIVDEITEALLCFEYVPQGRLVDHMFGESHKLEWETCFKIIKGICQGLRFLHSMPIVHMDLQPANILLDNNMVPKIADFGLSRFFGQEQTRMITQNVVGAHGYMAPEYLYRGEISCQSDIYSLGLLIMEITTAEKNCPTTRDHSAEEFIKNVRETWTDQQHIASKYSSVDVNCLQEIKLCITVGLECVEYDRMKRPSIEKVIDKLHG